MLLKQHPDVDWPPVFGASYSAGQPLMTNLEGTLVRVETVPATHREPEGLRLIALYEGHEFAAVLECRNVRLLPELRARLTQSVGHPVRELGDLEIG